jgi:hypothetical protein
LIDVRRREFFTLRVGTAAAWPGMSRSQKLEAVRRVVVLMGATETEWSRGWLAAKAVNSADVTSTGGA